jgi:peptidoglycan/LPS O-acetylase OafA/YrhL
MLGVDIFFALSGFLIGGILMDARGAPDFYRRFYVRRTLRIWPLYELVVLAVVVSSPFAAKPLGLPPWMLALFLGNWAVGGWIATRRAAGVLWSLAVEEHFYLLLPPIASRLNPKRLPIALAAMIVGATACRFVVAQRWGFMAAYVFTPCRIDALCWGVLAAWIVRHQKGWTRPLSIVAPWLCVARVAMLADNPASRIDPISVILLQPSASIATAALLVALASGEAVRIGRVLSAKVLTFFGGVSYGLYLLHPFVMEAMDPWMPSPTLARFAIITGVTSVFAWLSWRWFESPVLRLSDRLLLATSRWAGASLAQPEPAAPSASRP